MCCRGAWVVVTPAEVERYRKVGVARLYTDGGTIAEAMDIDPFEPVAHGHYRIRKRADGACGFLSADNRCRIHEELGGEAKPLACRVFPFRFHPVEGRPLVTTSASCPTIVKNEGAPLAAQAREIAALRAEWTRAFPETVGAASLHARAAHRGRDPGRDQGHAARGCWTHRPPAPGGSRPRRGAHGAVARGPVAPSRGAPPARRLCRVRRPHRAHAAENAAAPPAAAASAVTRLLSRGFLFTVLAVREQAAVVPRHRPPPAADAPPRPPPRPRPRDGDRRSRSAPPRDPRPVRPRRARGSCGTPCARRWTASAPGAGP